MTPRSHHGGGGGRGGQAGLRLSAERAQRAVNALAEGPGGLGGGEDDDRAAAPLRVGVVVVGGFGNPPDAGVCAGRGGRPSVAR